MLSILLRLTTGKTRALVAFGLLVTMVGLGAAPLQADTIPEVVDYPVGYIPLSINELGLIDVIPTTLHTGRLEVDAQGNRMYAWDGYPGTGPIGPPQTVPDESNDPPDDIELPLDYGPSNFRAYRVIGNDDRAPVPDSASWPYSAVVELRATFAGAGVLRKCTGWIYDDNHVATNAHCLYRRESSEWTSSIKVYPGRHLNSLPYGACNKAASPALSIGYQYFDSGDPNYDYGVIKMNCTVGARTGVLGYLHALGDWTGGNTTHVAYHNDRDAHQTQWHTIKRITDDDGMKLWYQHDNTIGSSGAPVYWLSSSGRPYVIAIHAHQYDRLDNSGVRMNGNVVDLLNNHR